MIPHIKQNDRQVSDIIHKELERQRTSIELIPSENFTSLEVMEAVGSVLTNKYSEGYPRKRYYGGNQFIDEMEELAIERAKKIFGVAHANVQPLSGSPANSAIYFALLDKGDKIMGLALQDGGHISHGLNISFSGKFFTPVPYSLGKNEVLDYDEIEKLASKEKPKIIVCGYTAYSRTIDFKRFGEIADKVGAYLLADISHITGLIIAGVHQSPVPYVDVIMTTTHKTLRGPRGAIIMVTQKGVKKDPQLPEKIDRAIFPGLQGGPHDHVTAGIAIALGKAMRPEFAEYGRQIVKNAKALAEALTKRGLRIVSNGTDTHLMLVDLTKFGKGKGIFVEQALDMAGITLNKNTIPFEPSSPFYPSGVRLGTPAVTTRGMRENDMEQIAEWIIQVVNQVKDCELPDDKEVRAAYVKKFKEDVSKNEKIKSVRKEVEQFCMKFPLYPEL